MIKVLANDGLQQGAIEKLISLGCDVDTNHYEKEALEEVLKASDVLIVRSATKVRKELLDKIVGGNLKLIIRAGVGIDNIDVEYAKQLGIKVSNTPNASSNSVAELALAHLLSVARHLGDANYSMRNGKWNKKQYEGTEISGKTLGVIGMGRIGRLLAQKAEALGMNIIYYDLFGAYENVKYEFVDLDDLLKQSDFISLHVPYDKNKGSLIGEREFSLMKDGVFIVNCARGKVIDEKALINALNDGKVAGAGIDVFEKEPTDNIELVNNVKVSATPHIGASTSEAQERIGEEVISIIKDLLIDNN